MRRAFRNSPGEAGIPQWIKESDGLPAEIERPENSVANECQNRYTIDGRCANRERRILSDLPVLSLGRTTAASCQPDLSTPVGFDMTSAQQDRHSSQAAFVSAKAAVRFCTKSSKRPETVSLFSVGIVPGVRPLN